MHEYKIKYATNQNERRRETARELSTRKQRKQPVVRHVSPMDEDMSVWVHRFLAQSFVPFSGAR